MKCGNSVACVHIERLEEYVVRTDDAGNEHLCEFAISDTKESSVHKLYFTREEVEALHGYGFQAALEMLLSNEITSATFGKDGVIYEDLA